MNDATRTTMRTTRILLLVLGSGSLAAARAQDAHFSQYETAPVLLNPALTGMLNGNDFRMCSNVRSQWNRLSNNYMTMAFSYDLAMQERYGAGLYLSNYDMAGMMNTFEVGATGAYNVSQSKAKHTLSVGVKGGLIYKKVNDAELLFDQQYNDGYFDEDLPSGETLDRRARLMPEIALGLAYRSIDPARRLNPFAGFSAFHLTTPDESIFRYVKSDLPIRWTAMGGVGIRVNDQLRLTPSALFMLQGADREINGGLLGECDLGGSAYSVMLGASCRLNDAVIGHVGLRHKNSAFRLSYDVNTSPLSEYTNHMGAFEFSFSYTGAHSGRDRRTKGSF
jgi:type IX secretion system PorP/SprF family membrane protein